MHFFCLTLVLCIFRLLEANTVAQESSPLEVLVRVNGVEITSADMRLSYYLQQLPADTSAEQRRKLTEVLVDRLLIERFLESRKVEAPAVEIERQLEFTKQLIAQRGGDYEKTLADVGLTEDQLKRTLALPLAWNLHVARIVTNAQVQEYFQQHRRELDGTKLTGAQIVKVVAADADETRWLAAKQELQRVREEIVTGKLTFADAAKAHSDSPAAADGGDLGKFEYRGRLPLEISSIAFALRPGELSDVFRTRFGMHLLQVTGETPGQLSPEDVRGQILTALGQRIWSEQVQIERKKARIQWPDAAQ